MNKKMFCVVALLLGALLFTACSETRDVINITPASAPDTYEVGISYSDTNPDIYEADMPYDDAESETEPETTPEPYTPAADETATPYDNTEEPETTPEPSTATIPGFNIADFEGTWTNSINETLIFPMPGFEIGEVWHTPNGAYIVEMIWQEGPGEMRVWLFPVGVEMIRYNLLGERMYNQKVVSDTSRARLFQGDFEVTSCCPDDKINETLFIRE